MIRTTQPGNQKRRLAVIAIPRPQQARLGVIRTGWPARDTTEAWTTISDEEPDSSANWLSYQMTQQAAARQTTPGTLVYTPASSTPAENVAPWNSWISPNCPAPSATVPTSTSTTKLPGKNWLWLLVGGLGAAASAVYLYQSAEYKGRR